jgi:hypothetical protein
METAKSLIHAKSARLFTHVQHPGATSRQARRPKAE